MKILCLLSITMLFLAGCSSNKSNEEQAIKDVIIKNTEARNAEDMEAYAETMDKDNDNFDRMEEMMNTIFKTYDLHYQVKDIKILEIKDNEAKVQFVQITKKEKGPTFRDTKVTGTQTLHKKDGKWKIYDTQITKVDYLN